eukprot:gene29572-biopygen5483
MSRGLCATPAADVFSGQSGIHTGNRGCFVANDYAAGDIIGIIKGVVVPGGFQQSDYCRHMSLVAGEDSKMVCCVATSDCPTQWINQSTDTFPANAEIDWMRCSGLPCLVAIRDIKKKEEIASDFSWTVDDATIPQQEDLTRDEVEALWKPYLDQHSLGVAVLHLDAYPPTLSTDDIVEADAVATRFIAESVLIGAAFEAAISAETAAAVNLQNTLAIFAQTGVDPDAGGPSDPGGPSDAGADAPPPPHPPKQAVGPPPDADGPPPPPPPNADQGCYQAITSRH